MSHLRPIDPGFSTADAEYPEILAAAGSIRLTFRDWQERPVKVQFNGVCAFRWQEAETLLLNEPYDGSSEVLDSDWAALHMAQDAVASDTRIRHLRFNFNACGQLEVLCVSYEIVA